MTRTILTGLLVFSLAACASNAEKKQEEAKADPGPAALGYTIMNRGGEALYCKQIRPTGSNVARSTRCLTSKEWQATQQDNQRTVEELRRGYDYPK
jgi:hypothetical protein